MRILETKGNEPRDTKFEAKRKGGFLSQQTVKNGAPSFLDFSFSKKINCGTRCGAKYFPVQKREPNVSSSHSAQPSDKLAAVNNTPFTRRTKGSRWLVRCPTHAVSRCAPAPSRRHQPGEVPRKISRVQSFALSFCWRWVPALTFVAPRPFLAGAMNENARRSTGDINTRGEKGEC